MRYLPAVALGAVLTLGLVGGTVAAWQLRAARVPVYTVPQIASAMQHSPRAWWGRTVLVRGRMAYASWMQRGLSMLDVPVPLSCVDHCTLAHPLPLDGRPLSVMLYPDRTALGRAQTPILGVGLMPPTPVQAFVYRLPVIGHGGSAGVWPFVTWGSYRVYRLRLVPWRAPLYDEAILLGAA